MTLILGGGLSGLSAAYYVQKHITNPKLKILILEAASRCGGWVESMEKDGFIFEGGPRTIRPKGPSGANTLNMIQELGLEEQVLPIQSYHPAAKNRMIFADNRLNLLPSSVLGTLIKRKPFSQPLASVLIHEWKAKAVVGLPDDTMYNFVERRFGKEMADYAISPMLCGICAGDAKEISVKFLLENLFNLEQKYGGIIKGLLWSMLKFKKSDKIELSKLAEKAREEKWSIYSMKGGLETLPRTLKDRVLENGGHILEDHKVEEIVFYNNNKKVRVRINNKDYSFCSDNLISCLPSYELARLLKNQHPQLAEQLDAIPFVNVGVVNLHYDSKNLLKHNAFGFLVPPKENLPILGVIFDSCCFTKQKGTVLTAMLGGKWFEKYFGTNATEEQIYDTAVTHVNKILGIEQKPDEFKVRILKKCIPQYVVGHHERTERIRKYIHTNELPLHICGSSYDGVGVNDVILSAKRAVEGIKCNR